MLDSAQGWTVPCSEWDLSPTRATNRFRGLGPAFVKSKLPGRKFQIAVDRRITIQEADCVDKLVALCQQYNNTSEESPHSAKDGGDDVI